MRKQLKDFAHITSDSFTHQQLELAELRNSKQRYYDGKPNNYLLAEIDKLETALNFIGEAKGLFGLLTKENMIHATDSLYNAIVQKMAEEAIKAIKTGDLETFHNLTKP